MLRSFDYAMHAALFNFVSERPDSRQTVESAGRQWRALTAQAFCDGYDVTAQSAGLASASGERRTLVELFVLEKALYELRYEVDNRPDWLRIPIAGLLDIVDAEAGR
jgi:maltose alpha-D-glucosyltransferase/alpha-amylase